MSPRTNKLVRTGAVAAVSLMAFAVPASASSRAPDVHPWLLTLSDMPLGWSVGSVGPSSPGCFSLRNAIARQHPGSSALVSFDYGQTASVEELVASWSSSASALRAWDAVDKQANGCHRMKISSGGESLTVTIEPMNLGRYGTSSGAFQVTGSQGGILFASDYLLALKGRVLLVVDYGSEGTPNLNHVEPVLKTAVGKAKG